MPAASVLFTAPHIGAGAADLGRTGHDNGHALPGRRDVAGRRLAPGRPGGPVGPARLPPAPCAPPGARPPAYITLSSREATTAVRPPGGRASRTWRGRRGRWPA